MIGLYQPIYYITYSTFNCPFESGKCGKEGGKLLKSEYLDNEKSFLDEIKCIFHSFREVIIWSKIKKLQTNFKVGENMFFVSSLKLPGKL